MGDIYNCVLFWNESGIGELGKGSPFFIHKYFLSFKHFVGKMLKINRLRTLWITPLFSSILFCCHFFATCWKIRSYEIMAINKKSSSWSLIRYPSTFSRWFCERNHPGRFARLVNSLFYSHTRFGINRKCIHQHGAERWIKHPFVDRKSITDWNM